MTADFLYRISSFYDYCYQLNSTYHINSQHDHTTETHFLYEKLIRKLNSFSPPEHQLRIARLTTRRQHNVAHQICKKNDMQRIRSYIAIQQTVQYLTLLSIYND